MVLPLAARTARVVKKTELYSDSVAIKQFEDSMKVIVGNDTVSMIIPEQNFGRYDRGLFNYLFIPKGSWSFGLTASYGELNTEDNQLLSILNNVDFKGKIYSIKPIICLIFIAHKRDTGSAPYHIYLLKCLLVFFLFVCLFVCLFF